MEGFERVYYLTGAQDLALQRIKVARFADLNDPFELLSLDSPRKTRRDALIKRKKDINEKEGLICFSRSFFSPVLWGHYADRHTGIGMGFDIPNGRLHEVLYEKKRRASRNDIPTVDELKDLRRVKFIDWEYEQEMRFFVDLTKLPKESGMYFYPFDETVKLRELILGPLCEIPIDRVRDLTARLESQVVVLKSRLAYRSFKVLIDHRASSQ